MSLEDDDQAGIDVLNEDCLEMIFCFLPIKDKLKVEQVCKKWQDAAKNSWKSFKNLNLSRETWGSPIFEQGVNKYNDHLLQKLVGKCGNYIKSIELIYHKSEFDFLTSVESRDFSRDFLTSVESGDFSRDFLTSVESRDFSRDFLTSVENFDCSWIGKCPNVETVNLKATTKILTSLIMKMNDNCRSILEIKIKTIGTFVNGMDMDNLDDKLETLCSLNKKLKVLKLPEDAVCENLIKNCLTESINTIVVRRFAYGFGEGDNLKETFKNLKNLKILNLRLSYYEISQNFINVITESCHNITDLSLNMEGLDAESYEKDLAEVFSILKIEKLKLKFSRIQGYCLIKLRTEYLNKFCLHRCHIIQTSYLISLITTSEKLSNLKIKCYNDEFKEGQYLNNQLIETISNKSKLNNLCLRSLQETSSVTYCYLNYLLQLDNLQVLNLAYNYLVNDLFLLAIRKKLSKLSNLNISGCENVTDHGIKELSTLSNLKYLLLDNLKITGQGFCSMTNLIILSCYRCENLLDEYLFKCVNNSLQYLDISHCSKITKNFVLLTNGKVSERSNNKLLSVIVTGTDLCQNEVNNISSNLKLIDKDEDSFYENYKDAFDYLKLSKY